LSRGHLLLFQLDACVLGFKHLKALYEKDKYFRVIYKECCRHPKWDFLIQEGYLFKDTRLYIPKCGTRELLVREVHGGSNRPLWGKQDFTSAQGALLFAEYGQGCARHLKEVCNMPNCQDSLPPLRSLHPFASSHLTLGGC